MTKKVKKTTPHIPFSNRECKAIFDASELLYLDIAEFDEVVPGKISACIGSTVAKLKNFKFDNNNCVEQTLPLTFSEFEAVHYSLLHTIKVADGEDDSIIGTPLAELSILADKISLLIF